MSKGETKMNQESYEYMSRMWELEKQKMLAMKRAFDWIAECIDEKNEIPQRDTDCCIPFNEIQQRCTEEETGEPSCQTQNS
jgi:hypothetical protein